MNVYEVYSLFHGVKLHFQSDYDFFKYGTPKYATADRFLNKERNKFQFNKLAKKFNNKEDLTLFLIYCFSRYEIKWIGAVLPYIEEFNTYKGFIESIEYRFTQFVREQDFKELFLIKDCLTPKLIEMVDYGTIEIEILIIFDCVLDVLLKWDKKFDWNPSYCRISQIVKKIKPFLSIERKKYAKIIKENVYK